MFYKIILPLLLLMGSNHASGENRFPRPDFSSGYAYPEIVYSVPAEGFWLWADVAVLVLLMSVVAWAVVLKNVRRPVLWVSLFSVAYFGFFRHGCVCSIGSVQNVALGLADSTYMVPLTVILAFVLPLLFALLFGRVFCAGVCPFGALQELVNVRNVRLSRSVTTLLGMIPWLYLALAVLFAITRSGFLLCRFDPFVGIFRLGGDWVMILFGILLLVISTFIGRPFCRFLCPYGALLGLVSRTAVWKTKITKGSCINCQLCHNSCPVDAIRPPYINEVKEKRIKGVYRVVGYLVGLPLLAGLMGMGMRYLFPELGTAATLTGAFMGGVVGVTLLRLSLKRNRPTYTIDSAACVSCGRCFTYCPINSPNSSTRTETKSEEV